MLCVVEANSFSARVRSAVFWRYASQITAQIVMWSTTIIVVRLLDPRDYGLFAMTQVVLVAFTVLNGDGFASSLIRAEKVDRQLVGQVFGLALLLYLIAPVAADYCNQPQVEAMLHVQCLLFCASQALLLPGKRFAAMS